MDGAEVKGLPQPPDRHARIRRRKKFNPKKRGFFGKAGKGRLRPKLNPKKRGNFGRLRVKPKKFGPVFRSKLAGRGPRAKKARGSTRSARQSTARGGFRRPKKSWLLKMAMAAIKRSMRATKPRDFRNHGYKGITKRGRTGLGGR